MTMRAAALAVFTALTALIAAPAFAADGAAVYVAHCQVCHGDKGDGNTRVRRGLTTPPRDFTTARARQELSRERMIASISHGRPGTAMVGFSERLSKEEIAAVADHIRATFMAASAGQAKALPAKLVLGEQLYVRNCAVCHGDKGSGAMWTQSSLNPAPRDFTSPATREELSRERMLTSVTFGRPGTAMMSFSTRLSPAEIETVVDYVRATFFLKESALPPEHAQRVQADMAQPFPNELRGDAAWGREFYERNCFTCHGKQGDGKGPRSKFINPKPRNFLETDSRARLNRPALFDAVRDGLRGTVMPAWGKVLSEQEIANVAEYVFTAFVHPATSTPPADKKKLNAP
ncbi:MAG: c-type cytochrome [Pseudomonadota bacterium]